ncbi:MAG: hypothetical protein CMC08_08080 [Flavobacteriaceae bacterium]|nr:hypothetical protein [Flavobacteriaceae bacterium]
MYLFLFTALFLIFQYMNEKRIFEDQEKQIRNLEGDLVLAERQRDSLADLERDANYFTLLGNDNAMTYFENVGVEAAIVEEKVREQIYDLNLQAGKNTLIPYEGFSSVAKINKLKFLNHRWIVADFTDGDRWGELLLEYFLNEDGSVDINVLSSVLYGN